MKVKLSKKIALALSLFISITGISYIYSTSVAQNDNKATLKEAKRVNPLFADPNWKKLGKIWKKYNQLDLKDKVNLKTQNFLNSMNTDQEEVTALLEKLKNLKLLTSKESEYINKLFIDRLSFIRFEKGLVLCYEMSQIGMKVVKKREDLEERYDILEKLYSEKKINSDTFNATVKKINEDFDFIENNPESSRNEKLNPELINLIINLNN